MPAMAREDVKMSKYGNQSLKIKIKNACAGISDLFSYEQSGIMRQCVITLISVILAVILKFGKYDYCFLFIMIIINFISEFFNTTIEYTHDELFKDEYSNIAKKAKDMAAGGVLFTLTATTVIGFIFLYLPKFLNLIK